MQFGEPVDGQHRGVADWRAIGVELEARQAAEERLEGDPELGARQRGPDTGVRAQAR
jgi:hypothetical protein